MSAQDFEQIFPLGEENHGVWPVLHWPERIAPLTAEGVGINNVDLRAGVPQQLAYSSCDGGRRPDSAPCTAGSGWYQAEGEEPVSLEPGSVVNIPAGLKHWHGAKADSWFSHVAIAVPGENTSNEWLEPVDDEHYEMPSRRTN